MKPGKKLTKKEKGVKLRNIWFFENNYFQSTESHNYKMEKNK